MVAPQLQLSWQSSISISLKKLNKSSKIYSIMYLFLCSIYWFFTHHTRNLFTDGNKRINHYTLVLKRIDIRQTHNKFMKCVTHILTTKFHSFDQKGWRTFLLLNVETAWVKTLFEAAPFHPTETCGDLSVKTSIKIYYFKWVLLSANCFWNTERCKQMNEF